MDNPSVASRCHGALGYHVTDDLIPIVSRFPPLTNDEKNRRMKLWFDGAHDYDRRWIVDEWEALIIYSPHFDRIWQPMSAALLIMLERRGEPRPFSDAWDAMMCAIVADLTAAVEPCM